MQVAANQPQYPRVFHPPCQPVHQQAMVHRVVEALQVAVRGEPQTIAVGLFHLDKRHPRAALRAEPVAVLAEVRIEERSYDLCDRLLNAVG